MQNPLTALGSPSTSLFYLSKKHSSTRVCFGKHTRWSEPPLPLVAAVYRGRVQASARQLRHAVAAGHNRHSSDLLTERSTEYNGVYHHSCHSWNSAGAEKVGALETARRELSDLKTYRSVLVPSWLPSNRAWKTAPGGCDLHTVVYRRLRCIMLIFDLPENVTRGCSLQ